MPAWLYLDEVTHRALNDYAVLLSIVRRASLAVSDPASGQALDEVALRLRATAEAFRALSPPHNSSPRNLEEELETLCTALSSSILSGSSIRLTLISDPVSVSANQSWKICLIVTELVRNAAQHAFRFRQDGAIVIELSNHAGAIRCGVIDNGHANPGAVPGRGSAILNSLAVELGGTLFRKHSDQGSEILLEIPPSYAR